MSSPSSHCKIVCRSWALRPVPLASKPVLSPAPSHAPVCSGVPIGQNRSYCNGDFMKVHFDPLEKDYKSSEQSSHTHTHTHNKHVHKIGIEAR